MIPEDEFILKSNKQADHDRRGASFSFFLELCSEIARIDTREYNKPIALFCVVLNTYPGLNWNFG